MLKLSWLNRPCFLFPSHNNNFLGKMEMLLKKRSQAKHGMVLFPLVVVSIFINAEFPIRNEQYRQTREFGLNFTKVDLGFKRTRFNCFRDCSHESSCIGVGIQATTTGRVRCFKMNKGSGGDAVLEDEVIYLRGKLCDLWKLNRFRTDLWPIHTARDQDWDREQGQHNKKQWVLFLSLSQCSVNSKHNI